MFHPLNSNIYIYFLVILIDNDVTGLLDVEKSEFQQLLSRGHFTSYENRLFLAGPCNVGKTSLASILIDIKIPLVWDSTNGLEIWFGRNGIHIKDKKMIPLHRNRGNYDFVTQNAEQWLMQIL